jgi:glucose/arabinose dehydrogenase
MKAELESGLAYWMRVILLVVTLGVFVGAAMGIVVSAIELSQHSHSNFALLSAVLVALRMREVLPWSILGTAMFALSYMFLGRFRLSSTTRSLLAAVIPVGGGYAFLALQVNLNRLPRFRSTETMTWNTVILVIAPIVWWFSSRLLGSWLRSRIIQTARPRAFPTLTATVVLAAAAFLPIFIDGTVLPRCLLQIYGYGRQGSTQLTVETIVTDLELPWGIAFLAADEFLVTELPGRLRLVRQGRLVETPVLTLAIDLGGAGGLLDVVLHPDFVSNRFFYLYFNAIKDGHHVSRVARYVLSSDHSSATFDREIFEAPRFHNGGRLRFGPDGNLYIGTGDDRALVQAQNVDSNEGKILRLTPDGEVPSDNPWPGRAAFMIGLRNSQAFDWIDKSTMVVLDHGPTGELGRTGHDEVNVVTGGGANLGWPKIFGCQSKEGMITPALTWFLAVPPGGAAIYSGDSIAGWRGDLVITSLRSQHLHRVVFDKNDPRRVTKHEVYLQDDFGRLRGAIMGPDGHLYIATSNCNNCPTPNDRILRLRGAR